MIGKIHVELQLEPGYEFETDAGEPAPVLSTVIPISDPSQIYQAFEQARLDLMSFLLGRSLELYRSHRVNAEIQRTAREDLQSLLDQAKRDLESAE